MPNEYVDLGNFTHYLVRSELVSIFALASLKVPEEILLVHDIQPPGQLSASLHGRLQPYS